jgi:ADP-ribose pyrophosphatase YjhB (NUDIX family)
MSDQDIDDAIDRAVREMMNVESSSATRARVLTSFDRPERRMRPWMLAAAAATIALALAIVVMRAPRQETSPSVATAPASPVAPVSPKQEPRVASNGERVTRTPRRHSGRTAARTVGETVAPELPETIPALAEIDPLVIPPARAPDIEPEEVVVPPLAAIPAIAFEPLPFPLELRE